MMNEVNDWWIGDWVKVKSTGITGQYHGMSEGKVILKTKDHSLVSTSSTDVEKIDDEVEIISEDLIMSPDVKDATVTIDDFGDRIDLHYESLLLTYAHTQGSKLEYQLDICTRFIQAAIQAKLMNIQIIHGRGQGILKNEVERILKQCPEITIISSNPNLASVDAWMNYH